MNKKYTITMKTSVEPIETSVEPIETNDRPWYDRMADAVVDKITEVQQQRDKIKRIEKEIAPSKEAARSAKARARAVAWARSQGYDLTYDESGQIKAVARLSDQLALPDQGANNTMSESPSLTDRVKREIFEIEKRTDLTTEEKVSRITHITCATCAGIAIQPIPFADIFILTPVQAFMGTRIAAIRGVPVSESEATDVIKEILGVIGMGFAAQQIALGIWKTLIPGAGGFMTIPIVYGLSYAIMRVVDAYFTAKAAKRKLTPDEIKRIWKNAKSEGEKQAKIHQQGDEP